MPLAWWSVSRSACPYAPSILIMSIACFNIASGDVEDAPALDPLAKFEIVEKDGAVFIKGEEATIKANRRSANIKCSAEGKEKIVIVGGFVLKSCIYNRLLS